MLFEYPDILRRGLALTKPAKIVKHLVSYEHRVFAAPPFNWNQQL